MLIDDGEITIKMLTVHEKRPGGGAASCLMEIERAAIWMSRVGYVPRYCGVSDFLSPGGRRCFEQGALPRELPWMDRWILNPYATSGLLSRRHRLLIISRSHKRDTLRQSGTSLDFFMAFYNWRVWRNTMVHFVFLFPEKTKNWFISNSSSIFQNPFCFQLQREFFKLPLHQTLQVSPLRLNF